MTRQKIIYLLVLPFLCISCGGIRDATDDDILPEAENPRPELDEVVSISAERLALLDSVVYIRANEALNRFLIAQREASRGNIEDALENAALSLEIYETIDAMVFKAALLSALGRGEEAAYWFQKASHLYPFADIDKYSDMLEHIARP
jgi:tetratricopeptide (TPR) repeat protein